MLPSRTLSTLRSLPLRTLSTLRSLPLDIIDIISSYIVDYDYEPIIPVCWSSFSWNRHPIVIDYIIKMRPPENEINWIGILDNPSIKKSELFLLYNKMDFLKSILNSNEWYYIRYENEIKNIFNYLELKVNWDELCLTGNNVELLKMYPEKINWTLLSANNNDEVVDFLLENKSNIDYKQLSINKNNKVVKLLFENKDMVDLTNIALNENSKVFPIFIEYHFQTYYNQYIIDYGKLSHYGNDNVIKFLHTINKIHWRSLCLNINSNYAIELLKLNPQNIFWSFLCMNTNSKIIDILELYSYNIDWSILSENNNTDVVLFLLKNKNNICFVRMCLNNNNPIAIKYIMDNLTDKNYNLFSHNTGIFKPLYNKEKIKEKTNSLKNILL